MTRGFILLYFYHEVKNLNLFFPMANDELVCFHLFWLFSIDERWFCYWFSTIQP